VGCPGGRRVLETTRPGSFIHSATPALLPTTINTNPRPIAAWALPAELPAARSRIAYTSPRDGPDDASLYDDWAAAVPSPGSLSTACDCTACDHGRAGCGAGGVVRLATRHLEAVGAPQEGGVVAAREASGPTHRRGLAHGRRVWTVDAHQEPQAQSRHAVMTSSRDVDGAGVRRSGE